jgi:hypothetical protein
MKKNDCFNLERQRIALQEQLTQKTEELNKISAQFSALKVKSTEKTPQVETGTVASSATVAKQS